MHEDIIYFSEKEEAMPFRIIICGTSYCDGTYKINRPDSSVCCMEYIVKGRGYVQIDEERFMASKGDVYILPAHKNHFYYSDAQDPWEKIWFNVCGDFVENTLKSYRVDGVYHIENMDVQNLFTLFLRHASKDHQEGSDSYIFDECALDFLKIVQAISSHIYSRETSVPKNYARLLKNKLDTLEEYTITFDELLKECFCSKSHLIRQFKAEYGTTPYQYLLEKKMNTAKALLLNTSMSISEISEYLGFFNPHYFSNFFKARTGVSPKAYRKR